MLLKIIILLLLLPSIAFGACTTPCTRSGNVWTCTDISDDCVQAAIWASEADHNTDNEIKLSAGSATWEDFSSCTFQDTGDTVTNNNHGIPNGTEIRFYEINETTGIATATKYYVVNSSTNTFQVSASLGGAALELTNNGTGKYYTYCSYVVDSTAAMCMHRGIKISGGYGGTTTITVVKSLPEDPGAIGTCYKGGILYYANSTARANAEGFELTGVTLDGNGDEINSSLLNITSYGQSASQISTVKIHHNVFQNGGLHPLEISGLVTGVIYSNTYTDWANGVKAEGGGSAAWNSITRGYANEYKIYFEDNQATAGLGFTAGTGHPGIVVRYNQLDCTDGCTDGLLGDLHGLQSMSSSDSSDTGECNLTTCYDYNATTRVGYCDQHSHIASEYYGNIWTNYNPTTVAELQYPRGSWFIGFNNRVSGAKDTRMRYAQYSCSSCYIADTAFRFACTFQDTGNTVTDNSHGLSNGTEIRFYSITSTTGIITNRSYYIVNASDNTFQVASTVGGDPLDLTTDGSGYYYKYYSMRIQNTYVWNNWTNDVLMNLSKSWDLCADYAVEGDEDKYTITENVDYWNYNSNTLNGSTQKGINCGSAAPELACSAGDGYWQTSYSPCSTPPTTIADMKTYSQAGKLWKCTSPSEVPSASNWTEYYSPYTYPHPLRNESSGTGAAVSIGSGSVMTIGSGATATLY